MMSQNVVKYNIALMPGVGVCLYSFVPHRENRGDSMILKVLVTVAAAATLVYAQGGDMGGGGGGGGRGSNSGTAGMSGMSGAGGGRPQKETKAEQIIGKLKLAKDQVGEFESILEVTYQEAGPTRDLLAKGRSALANATIEGKTEEIAKLTKDYTAVEAQMTAFEVKAFQKIYALLKPNQTAHAGEAFDLMAGILDPASGGRGMGGMRGRGGR
jgi:hypothetical protein